mgnify:CR=1 FL=1
MASHAAPVAFRPRAAPFARVPLGRGRHARLPRVALRASSSSPGEDDSRLMGRKGTNREAKEDDAETSELKKAVKLDGAFGKPSAAKETWEPYQRAARAGLLAATAPDLSSSPAFESREDPARTSLYLAMEDDAFKSRTAVPLPVDAYVKRVDKLVREFVQRDLPALAAEGKEHDTASLIAALEEYLYVQNGYRAPAGWREMYSPYRTYFHHVVAQKVGIPATLASLYLGCVFRLKQQGILKEDVDVLLRPKGANFAGVTAPEAPWGVPAGSNVNRPAAAVACTPAMLVKLQLGSLKRAFWPWEWDDARDSGTLLAMEAAAYGAENRMNTAAGVVGIIQPTGRPFGDLAMAILATERLLELDGGVGYEQRDLGVLLYHDGRRAEALEALEAYDEWRSGGGADAAPTLVGDVLNLGGSDAVQAAEMQVREDEALKAVMLELRKGKLEQTIAGNEGGGFKSGEV